MPRTAAACINMGHVETTQTPPDTHTHTKHTAAGKGVKEVELGLKKVHGSLSAHNTFIIQSYIFLLFLFIYKNPYFPASEKEA